MVWNVWMISILLVVVTKHPTANPLHPIVITNQWEKDIYGQRGEGSGSVVFRIPGEKRNHFELLIRLPN